MWNWRLHDQHGSLESGTCALRSLRAGRGECTLAARWKACRSRADAIRRAVRARAATGVAAHQACAARSGLGPPVRQRIGAEDRHQRAPDSARRRCAASRASSKRCRGEAIGSSPPRLRCPTTSSAGAGAAGIGSPHAAIVHRSRGSAFAPSPRLGHGVQRQARDRLGRRRTGYRQDDADRALRRGLGDVACRARPVRGALRCRASRIFPCLEALAELCRNDSTLAALAARRGTDLAAAAAVAQHRGGARRAATRARGRQPGPHAARDGRGARSLLASAGRCCW